MVHARHLVIGVGSGGFVVSLVGSREVLLVDVNVTLVFAEAVGMVVEDAGTAATNIVVPVELTSSIRATSYSVR